MADPSPSWMRSPKPSLFAANSRNCSRQWCAPGAVRSAVAPLGSRNPSVAAGHDPGRPPCGRGPGGSAPALRQLQGCFWAPQQASKVETETIQGACIGYSCSSFRISIIRRSRCALILAYFCRRRHYVPGAHDLSQLIAKAVNEAKIYNVQRMLLTQSAPSAGAHNGERHGADLAATIGSYHGEITSRVAA